jgi:hypothetical protein
LLLHSEHIRQRISLAFQRNWPAKENLSMNRKDNCWANAPAENQRQKYATHVETERIAFAYIETFSFYNLKLLHSNLGLSRPPDLAGLNRRF